MENSKMNLGKKIIIYQFYLYDFEYIKSIYEFTENLRIF